MWITQLFITKLSNNTINYYTIILCIISSMADVAAPVSLLLEKSFGKKLKVRKNITITVKVTKYKIKRKSKNRHS